MRRTARTAHGPCADPGFPDVDAHDTSRPCSLGNEGPSPFRHDARRAHAPSSWRAPARYLAIAGALVEAGVLSGCGETRGLLLGEAPLGDTAPPLADAAASEGGSTQMVSDE